MKKENTIITILGRKGSGKSRLAGEIMDEFPRVFIIDSIGEYEAPLIAWGLHDSVRLILQEHQKPATTISLRAVSVEDNLTLLSLLYEVPDCLIVIEEASLYCSPSLLPDEIAALVRYGRHRRISLLFVARRPSELHRDITGQSDVLVSFCQREPRDIDYFRAWGDVAEAVQKLGPYQIIALGELQKAPLAVLARLPRIPIDEGEEKA